MLKKNVYIFYPPGYSGSYINWAIHISDLDCRNSTVKDPINGTASSQFGGVGSSHHHVRTPTHLGYQQVVNWILLNRPKEHKVYIVNSSNRSTYVTHNVMDSEISQVAQHDPTAVIIAITHNNNWKIASYGYINGIMKWPTRVLANSNLEEFEVPFDVFDCANSLIARNWFVSKDIKFSNFGCPINHKTVDRLVNNYLNWYNCRSKLQPHEVNPDNFVDQIDLTNRIFELNCHDVSTDRFVDIFADIMHRAQISDNFDLEYISQYHHRYCDAQQNLQWFDSAEHWERTGELDQYLLSHSCIQACVVQRMFQVLELHRLSTFDPNWVLFYHKIKDPTWPDCANERSFHVLPDSIKQEMIGQFSYKPLNKNQLQQLIDLYDNWQSMTTQDINQLYQQLILQGD